MNPLQRLAQKLPVLALPNGGYLVVSPILVIINLVVFLVLAGWNGSFSNYSYDSLYWLGVNYSTWVDQGQWWRLVSSMFLHFGVMHLMFNSVSLLFLGRILEPALGRAMFITVYFTTGFFGSLASYVFNKGVFSAGASGAIFGLLGVFVGLLLGNTMPRAIRKQWLKDIGLLLVLNVVFGFIAPVDNAAHMGGLVTGVVIGLLLLPFFKPPK